MIVARPDPLGGTGARGTRPDLAVTIAGRLRSLVAALASTHGVPAYAALQGDIEALCGSYVVEAFAALDWRCSPGEAITAVALADDLGVVPAHRRLFDRLLEILEEDGVLRSNGAGAGWTVLEPPGHAPADRLHEALVSKWPSLEAELSVLARCARALPRVLRGQADPLQLLFPGGSMEPLKAYYAHTPFARVLNTLVGEAAAMVVERASPGAPARIIEVGAGTGSTTAEVLPFLRPEATDYTFTDLSPFFTLRATRSFRAVPFLRVRELDLETDPEVQGFACASFDIVIAANVLHATRNLRRALQHVHRLLRPGGLIVLREVVVRQRRRDLIFGLSTGWWNFTDVELRPRYALLPAAQWVALLDETGFRHAAAIPDDAGPEAEFDSAVFVAQTAEESA